MSIRGPAHRGLRGGTCLTMVAVCLASFLPSAAAREDARSAAELLAYAKTAPCSVAQRIYRDLAADSSAADSLRTLALGLSADALFAAGEFGAARDAYARAAQTNRKAAYYQHRAGVAALKAGDTADATAHFMRSVACNDTEYSHRSRVMLGDLACAAGDYERAMALFQATGSFSAKNSYAVPAFIGKLECAKRLGLADSAAVYDRLLSLYAKSMLERERYKRARDLPLQRGVKMAPRTDTIAKRPGSEKKAAAASSGGGDTSFTLQVGSFGSRERAEELQQRLSKQFKGVVCLPAVVSDKTYYRVCVGEFGTREQADLFGKRNLETKGHEYRIVVKQ